jgi:CheY-like chemotaxis protein
MAINQNLSIKILLIEDNEGDIILTREALGDSKILNQLVCLKDGESALDFLKKISSLPADNIPDLILLDINLPKINGHEIMEFVNNDSELKKIPIFVLSSSKAIDDIRASKKNNASYYLIKPLDVYEFINGIKNINSFWFNIIKLV